MTGWLKLLNEQRKISLSQASQKSGISAKAIEKDWWVTLVLKALFQSGYAKYLVFKGGTSLSKGHKLINRFSEDIDLALFPEAFGIGYEEDPDKRYLKNLRKKGYEFSTTKLLDELKKQLHSLGLPDHMVTYEFETIKENQSPPDPQVIYVNYKSLFEPNPYLPDQVKIEVSLRSLTTPSSPRPILSLLYEFFPAPAYKEETFQVPVAEASKTFLEKTFLLHEEFGKTGKENQKTERMSRHFYDLAMMDSAGIFSQVMSDQVLYDTLVTHRRRYIAASWVDYSTLHPSRILFLPPLHLLSALESDYASMHEEMIYGANKPSFSEIIKTIEALQEKFRTIKIK